MSPSRVDSASKEPGNSAFPHGLPRRTTITPVRAMTTSLRVATTEYISPSSQCHHTGARRCWPQWRLRPTMSG